MHRLVVVANYTHILLSKSGALCGGVTVGCGGRDAAAALLICINLVFIVGLKGGQFNGDSCATCAAASGGVALGHLIIIIIKVCIEGFACRIRAVALDGGA